MSDEQDKLKVSLEPPKLFGRKKKSKKTDETASASERSDEPAPSSNSPDEPRSFEPPADEPPSDEPPSAEDAAPPPDEGQPEPEAPEPETPEPEPETPEPDLEAQEAPEAGPEAEPEPAVADSEVAPSTAEQETPTAEEADDTEVIETGPVDRAEEDLPAAEDDEPLMDEIETGLDNDDDLAPGPTPAAAASPSLVDRIRGRFDKMRGGAGSAPSAEPGDEEEGTAYTAPMLDHYPAAVLTGAIVGLGMVVLTWLSLRGCEAIRGTASCGGGPGFLLLVAMFIVSVMLGSAILKSFEVPDPGSSSFLAVGLVAVVSLLLLIDVLDHWSMLLVIPLLSVGAYTLSVYITKTFVEPDT